MAEAPRSRGTLSACGQRRAYVPGTRQDLRISAVSWPLFGTQAQRLKVYWNDCRIRQSEQHRPGPRCSVRKAGEGWLQHGLQGKTRCLEYLREGDTLLVSKIDRLARSTSDLYRIISELADKGVAFRVVDDPTNVAHRQASDGYPGADS